MNITIDALDNLTPDQLDLIDLAQKLLGEARRDLATVKEYCKFRLGETCITLNDSLTTKEYIFHNGTYQLRQGGRAYELQMTDNAIFEAYKLWANAAQATQIYKDVGVFRARVLTMRQALESQTE